MGSPSSAFQAGRVTTTPPGVEIRQIRNSAVRRNLQVVGKFTTKKDDIQNDMGISGICSGIADPTRQYLIQTDQGPERLFRYQTLTGQFRKEKRLENGDVTGTYGWVDPNNVLRTQARSARQAGQEEAHRHRPQARQALILHIHEI